MSLSLFWLWRDSFSTLALFTCGTVLQTYSMKAFPPHQSTAQKSEEGTQQNSIFHLSFSLRRFSLCDGVAFLDLALPQFSCWQGTDNRLYAVSSIALGM